MLGVWVGNSKAVENLDLQTFHLFSSFLLFMVISCQMQDAMYNKMYDMAFKVLTIHFGFAAHGFKGKDNIAHAGFFGEVFRVSP